MGLTAGIDAGSAYTKVAIADSQGEILVKIAIPSGYNFPKAAQGGLDLALQTAGLAREAVDYIAATGYGRYMVPIRDLAITELTCHAWPCTGSSRRSTRCWTSAGRWSRPSAWTGAAGCRRSD